MFSKWGYYLGSDPTIIWGWPGWTCQHTCASQQERGSLPRAPDISKEAAIFSCPDISSFRSPANNRCTVEFHRNHLKQRFKTGSMYGPIFNRALFCWILPHLAWGKKWVSWTKTLKYDTLFYKKKKVIFLMRKAPVCFLWLCHNPAVFSASLCH